MVGLLFTLLILASSAYAFLAGGRDGRWATTMLLGAALATIPASKLNPSWGSTHFGVLGVDLALLAGLVWLALRTDRYWPIWLAALHLGAVATHLATLIGSQDPAIYRMLQTFWSIPMQIILPLGIALDRRRGLHHDEHSTPDVLGG